MNALLALFVGVGLAADPVWYAPLDTDNGGLTSGGDTGQWAWDVVSYGPPTCYTGNRCWATGPGGLYLNDAQDWLAFPHVDLTPLARPVLLVRHWYSIRTGDSAVVQVDDGGGFVTVDPIYGYPSTTGWTGESDGWVPAWVDLTGIGDLARVRLLFASDPTGAAAGWYVDDPALYEGDVVPPLVSWLNTLADTDDLAGPYAVSAKVEDDVAVTEVVLRWSADGGAVQETDLSPDPAPWWGGSIPGHPPDTTLWYQVVATDGYNETRYPEEGASFRVRLPAPTDLVADAALVWGSTTTLRWTPPDSRHGVVGYRVWRGDEEVATATAPDALVPLVMGDQSFSVSATYEVGDGDRSDPVTVTGAVPTIVSVSPDEGYPGDRLRLKIMGSYLLLVDGDVSMDLEDVEVVDLTVRDVDTLLATVQVPEDAAPGSRDLVLESGEAVARRDAAFQVIDSTDRPRLVSLSPERVTQGDATTLVITASERYGAVPTVRIGDAIIVEDVRIAGDGVVEADIVVPYGADVGGHDVEVDDGTRIFTGLELQVQPYNRPVTTCSLVPDPAASSPWILAFGALLARRRRRYSARMRPPSTGTLVPRT